MTETQNQRWWSAPALRWTIVFIVAVIALIVAIWPRSDDPMRTATPTSSDTSAVKLTDAPVADAEVAAAREQAKLADCPVTGSPIGPTSELAGVSAPCLASGSTYDVGAGTAGKPVLINMWATWCLPCGRELPVLQDYAKRAGNAITVLTVHSVDGSRSPFLVLKFLADNGVRLPTVLDTKSQIAAALSAPKVFPSTILVRADGTVAKVLPEVFESTDAIAAAVETNLGVRT
ncbi:putative thiol-disulfide oxidoreductase [Gordonia effusa NBRC 100432]|uniref:Putative thiol-disulfide oxidoreductase n=1 Tax=Gordonia effusa NBRC 100432 TaxID=1077974 RepID=H0QX48_9ACTN|nr:TlpA family protein disulfide reductase [Gordonia effusa]GAB17399.1 putative thiol-disulfide oxidoreductase [Gordonia effusa NBRC 100432]